MVSEVPAYQNTRLLTSVGNSSFKIYYLQKAICPLSRRFLRIMRVAEKRIVRTDRASVSTNMLRVTPSSALSVKVILQIM